MGQDLEQQFGDSRESGSDLPVSLVAIAGDIGNSAYHSRRDGLASCFLMFEASQSDAEAFHFLKHGLRKVAAAKFAVRR